MLVVLAWPRRKGSFGLSGDGACSIKGVYCRIGAEENWKESGRGNSEWAQTH